MKSRFTFLKFIFPSLLAGLLVSNVFTASATTHTILANGGSNTFTPDNLNALVGDTVVIQNNGGSHDPTSTSVPNGADDFEKILSGNDTLTYVLQVAGIYSYKCNFHGGMTGTITVGTPTKIAAPVADNPIRLYPQPIRDKLTIDLNRNPLFKDKVAIEISNSIGQREFYTASSDIISSALTIDVADLSPGIYFVSISEGTVKKTYRLIKSQ